MQYLTKKEKLSKVLTRERERRSLSQQEVADAVDASLRNYQRWESGDTFPHSYSLQKLQDFFGECINEVMIFDPREHPLPHDRVLAGDQEEPEAVPPQEEHENQSTPEPFSEPNERTAETATNEPPMTSTTLPTKKPNLPLLCAILLILLVVAAIGLLIYITNSTHPTVIKPGGIWSSPSGNTVGDVISFAAYAYPTNPGDPAIDHVNFTIYWQGVDPHKWIIACVAHIPVRNDIYACSVNLRQLGVPPGKIKISFDVYDRQGNKNLAPNGEHILVYSPGAAS